MKSPDRRQIKVNQQSVTVAGGVWTIDEINEVLETTDDKKFNVQNCCIEMKGMTALRGAKSKVSLGKIRDK